MKLPRIPVSPSGIRHNRLDRAKLFVLKKSDADGSGPLPIRRTSEGLLWLAIFDLMRPVSASMFAR